MLHFDLHFQALIYYREVRDSEGVVWDLCDFMGCVKHRLHYLQAAKKKLNKLKKEKENLFNLILLHQDHNCMCVYV